MLPLEKALFDVPPDVLPKDRDASIVARHYGFDGRGGANFQLTGDEFGLTRERVRQIVADAVLRGHILPSGLAALDRVIAFVEAMLPAPAAEVERKMQLARLTARPFRIEGVVSVAALVSRPVPFQIRALKKTRFVLPTAWPQFVDILRDARNQVRRHGMATIAQFVNGASGDGSRRDANMVEAILSARRDFRWLDRPGGWFWFAETNGNRVVRRIRKMLAVANPLPVRELRAGLCRMGSPLAPEPTLLTFCRQVDGFSVRGEMVHADPGIETARVLNKTELDIYRLLSDNNGCMSNSELSYQSNMLGMKRPTFYQCVTCSPIVARCDRSNYRLIGSPG